MNHSENNGVWSGTWVAERLGVGLEGDAVAVDDGRGLRDVLAEDVGHQQVGPLGVAAQGQPQQVRQAVVALQSDPEPLGDPGAGPDPVVL
jgi:hypothetical protein